MDALLAPLEAGEEESVSIEDEDETEVEPLKVATGPKLPSTDAVEQHRCLHIPYLAWCKFASWASGVAINIAPGQGRPFQRLEWTTSSPPLGA